ncbi:MAG: D-2-hydroxyacid dehydrogenase [Candidatus Polarisedimenticolaceae bacterium]|nr:D-2-hydroxyacid dehydrogenase [Candidatus Polarisedimenticolaceae bacterium]
MPKAKAVMLDAETIDCNDIDFSHLQRLPFVWQYHAATDSREQTMQYLKNVEVVVSNKVELDREVLLQADCLKLICVAATGTNNVDLEAAAELGIAVTNVANYSTPSVVQWVFTHLLALRSRLLEHHVAVRCGDWQHSPQFTVLDYPFAELSGQTIGIVGYGTLGRAVAKVAEAFGMRVLICQPLAGEPVDGRLPLNELLTQVDVLSLHCPLTKETQDLIGAGELALMRSDAILINTSRGGVVNEVALAHALREEQIAGAGVDVLSSEPPSEDNPLLASGVPHLIVTPHIAWASRESRQRLVDELAKNIQAFLADEARNRVV